MRHLNIDKSLGLDEMHPRVLREVEVVGPRALSITFQKSWQAGKVSSDWRKGNVTPSQNTQVFYCTIHSALLHVVIVQHRFTNLNKVCKTSNSLGMF